MKANPLGPTKPRKRVNGRFVKADPATPSVPAVEEPFDPREPQAKRAFEMLCADILGRRGYRKKKSVFVSAVLDLLEPVLMQNAWGPKGGKIIRRLACEGCGKALTPHEVAGAYLVNAETMRKTLTDLADRAYGQPRAELNATLSHDYAVLPEEVTEEEWIKLSEKALKEHLDPQKAAELALEAIKARDKNAN